MWERGAAMLCLPAQVTLRGMLLTILSRQVN